MVGPGPNVHYNIEFYASISAISISAHLFLVPFLRIKGGPLYYYYYYHHHFPREGGLTTSPGRGTLTCRSISFFRNPMSPPRPASSFCKGERLVLWELSQAMLSYIRLGQFSKFVLQETGVLWELSWSTLSYNRLVQPVRSARERLECCGN